MIHLEPKILEQLSDDAFRTYPNECCGFLLGEEKGSNRYVKEIIVINNAKEGDKRRRFEITPLDYIQAERYADQNELTLLGIYHSHPNHPSIPSEQDRVAAQPFFSYIILSISEDKRKKVQSWVLNDQFQFEEEKIILTKTLNHFKTRNVWQQ